jgi:enoyl-CoA hydratase/carnithine racemase
MKWVQTEKHDEVVVLKLSRGTTNALNLQLVQELSIAIERVKDDSSAGGLVLASSNDKFFSIGFDLQELLDVTRNDFVVFYRAFNQVSIDLYALPKPTIAAVTGHAVAGGCILALCCDNRFMADGHKLMGVNEVKLGVPVPYPGDCILRQVVSSLSARDIMLSGEFYTPEESLRVGLVDEVLPLGKVLVRSMEKVRSMGSLPQGAFGLIKRNRTERVVEQIQTELPRKEESFLECWHSQDAQRLLREARNKF